MTIAMMPHATHLMRTLIQERESVIFLIFAKAAQFAGFLAGWPFQMWLMVKHQRMSITIVIAFKTKICKVRRFKTYRLVLFCLFGRRIYVLDKVVTEESHGKVVV